MAKITFREERCKGCGLCTAACPRNLVVMAGHINEMGYHPAAVPEQEKCTGCALCALVCPDLVIEVEREEKAF
ncbi:ferredoxin [Pelotomaculum thermopropionicum SI]|uniref:Ferredoxin n=1 Tax=Pelotomaculum thermopropionicum (strain DSM 13744 / JCM 10971 / SI) TaxID=370438 RepID=A5D304_PELTS|nr:ferredoxin [Pelotomaculum thermopropionicum SI]